MTAQLPGVDPEGMLPVPPPPAPTRRPPRPGMPRRVGGPPRPGSGPPHALGVRQIGKARKGAPCVTRAPAQARPPTLDREAIIARIRMLWDHSDVPSWHRALYSTRYFKEGGCRREVLLGEAGALAQGEALVLVTMRCIQDRESVLSQLEQLRCLHEDADLQEGTHAARSLVDLLLALRSATVSAVEALSAWHRSVAPLLGANSSVVGPSARGACWPHGPRQEDYLWVLTHRDEVVRMFAAVLDLSPVSDPFLQQCSMPVGAGAEHLSNQLQLPAPRGRLAERMEAAKLLLLEQELAGVVLSAGAPAPEYVPIGAALSPSSNLALALTEAAEAKGSNEEEGAAAEKSVLPTLWPDWPQRPQSAQGRHRDTIRPTLFLKEFSQDLSSKAVEELRPRSALSGKRRMKKRSWKVTDKCIPKLAGSAMQAHSASKARTGVSSDTAGSPKGHVKFQAGHASRRASRTADENRQSLDSTGDGLAATLEDGEQENSGVVGETPTIDGETPHEFKMAPVSHEERPLVERSKLENLWKKYSHDESLHRDDLPKLLEVAGLLNVTMEGWLWIDEIFEGITRYNSIEHEDFFTHFIVNYENRQRQAWNESFNVWDKDKSGTIEHGELADLLRSLGIEPMTDVLKEVISEVDYDQNGNLNLGEFYDVMKRLREREGFSKTEYTLFIEVFETFDHDRSGQMDTHELSALLNYLGFSLDHHAVSLIIRDVDCDGSGSLDKHEFLVCMRKVRDREVSNLKSLMKEKDADGSGTLAAGELHDLLNSLEYFIDDDVLEEIVVEVGVDIDKGLDLSDLWKFMLTFRGREGLSMEEWDAIDEAYARYTGMDNSGHDCGKEMRTTEVGKLLRYMGYSMSFEEQQILIMQVDVNETGYLQKSDLRKMIRMARDQEVNAAKEVFKSYSFHAPKGILVNDVKEALRATGCVGASGRTPGFTSDMLDDNGLTVSKETFLRMVRKEHKQNRRIFRENGGFSEKDLDDLRERFNAFDVDGSGDINQAELVQLIETIFPRMSHDVKLRPRLLDIMREVDQNGNGRLDFQDFLRLMRICRDQQDREALSKERRAVDETKFTPAEVHEFRDFFMQSPGLQDGELPIPEVIRIVSSICKLGEKNTLELKDKLSDMHLQEGKGRIEHFPTPKIGQSSATASSMWVEGSEETRKNPANFLDFADFLRLMQWMLDFDFGNVIEQTSGAAARYKSTGGDTSRRNARTVPKHQATGSLAGVASDDLAFFFDDKQTGPAYVRGSTQIVAPSTMPIIRRQALTRASTSGAILGGGHAEMDNALALLRSIGGCNRGDDSSESRKSSVVGGRRSHRPSIAETPSRGGSIVQVVSPAQGGLRVPQLSKTEAGSRRMSRRSLSTCMEDQEKYCGEQ